MFNLVDSLVGYVNPMAGVRRLQARKVLASYEATKPGRLRKDRNKNPSPIVWWVPVQWHCVTMPAF